MVVLFPVFKEISTLFSIVAVSVFILTDSIGGFPFLHIHSNTVCRLLMLTILTTVTSYLIVVLICISLLMSEVEHPLMSLLRGSVFTLEVIDI